MYWDGNDINEWGYDDGSNTVFKNTKNNRKSNEFVTRDDDGNIIPLSKRFNSRNADERFSLEESPDSAFTRSVDDVVGGKVYVRAKDESVNTADGILFSIYSDDADKVARAAERIGLTVHRDSIRISNSEYIEVSDDSGESFKIHVSDDALPSHYTQLDVNVLAKGDKKSNHTDKF